MNDKQNTAGAVDELQAEVKRSHEHVDYLTREIERATDFKEVKRLEHRLDLAKAYASGLQRAEHFTALAKAKITEAYEKGRNESREIQK